MARPARPRPRVSLWVAAVVVAALAIGGAAALLTAPVAPNPPSYVYTPFDITVTEAGWLVVAFVVLWLAVHLFERQRQGSAPIPGRAISLALLAILLAVAFVLLARAFGPHPSAMPGQSQSAPGGSKMPTPASLNNTTNLTVNETGFAPLQIGGWSIPGWVVLAALFGVAAIVALIAVPLYLAARPAPTPRRSPGDGAGPRSDFAAALQRLNVDNDADVREVIIALYARLLTRVGAVLGDLDARAPREIELACVHTLHIRPETAHALTALFEEARYSTHPLDAATGDRARETFRRAVADLDASGLRAS